MGQKKKTATEKSEKRRARISRKWLFITIIGITVLAYSSFHLWMVQTYALTPLELIQITRFGLPSLSGLEVLPGYLDIDQLPGYMEARADTIQTIREIMEESDFEMYDLVLLAKCESTINPLAYNKSGATGLFQFMKRTWGTTPYCNEDIWDVEAQTKATIWMFEHNRYSEWECFKQKNLKQQAKYPKDYKGCGQPV